MSEVNLVEAYTFRLVGKELETFLAWEEEHNKTCPFYDDGTSPVCPSGAIGGQMTFCFTNTGLGTIVVVECLCYTVHKNEKGRINVTDFDNW